MGAQNGLTSLAEADNQYYTQIPYNKCDNNIIGEAQEPMSRNSHPLDPDPYLGRPTHSQQQCPQKAASTWGTHNMSSVERPQKYQQGQNRLNQLPTGSFSSNAPSPPSIDEVEFQHDMFTPMPNYYASMSAQTHDKKNRVAKPEPHTNDNENTLAKLLMYESGSGEANSNGMGSIGSSNYIPSMNNIVSSYYYYPNSNVLDKYGNDHKNGNQDTNGNYNKNAQPDIATDPVKKGNNQKQKNPNQVINEIKHISSRYHKYGFIEPERDWSHDYNVELNSRDETPNPFAKKLGLKGIQMYESEYQTQADQDSKPIENASRQDSHPKKGNQNYAIEDQIQQKWEHEQQPQQLELSNSQTESQDMLYNFLLRLIGTLTYKLRVHYREGFSAMQHFSGHHCSTSIETAVNINKKANRNQANLSTGLRAGVPDSLPTYGKTSKYKFAMAKDAPRQPTSNELISEVPAPMWSGSSIQLQEHNNLMSSYLNTSNSISSIAGYSNPYATLNRKHIFAVEVAEHPVAKNAIGEDRLKHTYQYQGKSSQEEQVDKQGMKQNKNETTSSPFDIPESQSFSYENAYPHHALPFQDCTPYYNVESGIGGRNKQTQGGRQMPSSANINRKKGQQGRGLAQENYCLGFNKIVQQQEEESNANTNSNLVPSNPHANIVEFNFNAKMKTKIKSKNKGKVTQASTEFPNQNGAQFCGWANMRNATEHETYESRGREDTNKNYDGQQQENRYYDIDQNGDIILCTKTTPNTTSTKRDQYNQQQGHNPNRYSAHQTQGSNGADKKLKSQQTSAEITSIAQPLSMPIMRSSQPALKSQPKIVLPVVFQDELRSGTKGNSKLAEGAEGLKIQSNQQLGEKLQLQCKPSPSHIINKNSNGSTINYNQVGVREQPLLSTKLKKDNQSEKSASDYHRKEMPDHIIVSYDQPQFQAEARVDQNHLIQNIQPQDGSPILIPKPSEVRYQNRKDKLKRKQTDQSLNLPQISIDDQANRSGQKTIKKATEERVDVTIGRRMQENEYNQKARDKQINMRCVESNDKTQNSNGPLTQRPSSSMEANPFMINQRGSSHPMLPPNAHMINANLQTKILERPSTYSHPVQCIQYGPPTPPVLHSNHNSRPNNIHIQDRPSKNVYVSGSINFKVVTGKQNPQTNSGQLIRMGSPQKNADRQIHESPKRTVKITFNSPEKCVGLHIVNKSQPPTINIMTKQPQPATRQGKILLNGNVLTLTRPVSQPNLRPVSAIQLSNPIGPPIITIKPIKQPHQQQLDAVRADYFAGSLSPTKTISSNTDLFKAQGLRQCKSNPSLAPQIKFISPSLPPQQLHNLAWMEKPTSKILFSNNVRATYLPTNLLKKTPPSPSGPLHTRPIQFVKPRPKSSMPTFAIPVSGFRDGSQQNLPRRMDQTLINQLTNGVESGSQKMLDECTRMPMINNAYVDTHRQAKKQNPYLGQVIPNEAVKQYAMWVKASPFEQYGKATFNFVNSMEGQSERGNNVQRAESLHQQMNQITNVFNKQFINKNAHPVYRQYHDQDIGFVQRGDHKKKLNVISRDVYMK